VGLALAVRFGNDVAIALEGSAPSVSRGRSESGSLSHGRRLPTAGANFVAYSYTGAALGRNTVHVRVRDAVVESYAELARTMPTRRWMYGECGWPSGGRFRPHHTHQNGLSVDFIVPVLDRGGRPTTLTSWAGNLWTYAVDFDARGCAGETCIDFEAISTHLESLGRYAVMNGLRVSRVIFDPAYHPRLFATERGPLVRERIPMMPRRAWVRHDEHYHVDFVRSGP
jgi:penicillin-insensitive murein endopeptidase